MRIHGSFKRAPVATTVLVLIASALVSGRASSEDHSGKKPLVGKIVSVDSKAGDIVVEADGRRITVSDILHYFGEVSSGLSFTASGADFTARLPHFKEFKVGDRVEIVYQDGRQEVLSMQRRPAGDANAENTALQAPSPKNIFTGTIKFIGANPMDPIDVFLKLNEYAEHSFSLTLKQAASGGLSDQEPIEGAPFFSNYRIADEGGPFLVEN